MLVLLTKDLFFAPTIRGIAEQNDLAFQLINKLDPSEWPALALPVTVWILDLSMLPANQVVEATAKIQADFGDARSIAFGQHVHVARLEAAQEAGFDAVLTRGQLAQKLPDLL